MSRLDVMKIGLVGGIYEKGGARKRSLKITPETTLEEGLRAAGHEVTPLSHYDAPDFGEFDLVHVHHLSYGAMRLASDRSSTPFVFTAHDASRMNGVEGSRTRDLSMRYVLSRADGVVSLSSDEAAFQSKTYPIDGARQATIPNGIDPSLFSFRRANTAGCKSAWQLLYCGQLIPIKGCELLFRAVALLKHDWELSLAFQFQTLELELRNLAQDLGIADRIRFLGKQEPTQLADLYQSSDLLLLPSETEALPSVITEAMLCGLPFVASRVGGIPDQAGGFGVLFEQRTPEALAAAITHALNHYADHHGAAESMSNYARARFTVDSMIQQHIDLYRSLVGKTARRRSVGIPGVDWLVRTAVARKGRGGPSATAVTTSEASA